MMMRGRSWGTLVVGGFALAAGPVASQEYDAPETEMLVERFLEAQGGIAAWNGAGAVSYDHVMFTPSLYQEGDTHWWASSEVIEKGTLRAYAEWPIDGARLAHDGERVWSVGWKRPNPPAGMARIHYYLIFLTWLTQEDEARLTRAEPRTLPGDDVESFAVDVAFGDGDAPFAVFIDPETYHLRGFRNRGTLHTVHRLGDADGLRVPIDWTTYANGEVIGHHSVYRPRLLEHFDESLLVAPADAVRGHDDR